MIRRVLPAAIIAIVANLAMLASVRGNRAGEPDATLQLTERELQIVPASERESVRWLRLMWSQNEPAAGANTTPDWLTEQKLAELGMECTPRRARSGRNAESASTIITCGLPRRVFAALEFDGPAWAARVERLRRSVANDPGGSKEPASRAASIEREIRGGSRLVIVDASLDAAALRAAHPDRTRYAILPATATAWINSAPTDSNPRLTAVVRPITTRLLAPTSYNAMLSGFRPLPYDSRNLEPRYIVRLAVGRHYEPWITTIAPTP